jgi:phosphatidylglycerophosphate synthase
MTLLAVVLLALSGYLDSMDGSLARFTQRSSSVGAVLDLLADRIVEAAVLIALYSLAPVDRSLTVILVLASFFICISSFLVVSLFYTQQTRNAQGKSFHYSKGLIERGETFIFFALMILLPDWFTGLAGLLAVLVVWTALFRIWQFIQQAS